MTVPTTRRALLRLLLVLGLVLGSVATVASPAHPLHRGASVHAATASDSLPVRVDRHAGGDLPPVHQVAAVVPAQAVAPAPAEVGTTTATAAGPAYGGVLARAGRGPPGA